jgi:ABC-type glycerol-3-phosphate transport system permease component
MADKAAAHVSSGPRFYQSRRFQDAIRNGFVYFLLIFLSFVFLFPFFWMLDSALKTDTQIFLWPPQWIPDPVRWQNFVNAFTNPQLPFAVFVKNTLILEVFIITGRLISCVVVAYGFARLEAPGKNFWFGVLLATFMLPGAVILIPKYILFNKLGWVNTFLPLIVPAWFGESFAIFLLRQFFMTIPRELEEAAVMDGANTLDIIGRIMVPLSTPVLAVITVFSFRDIWNDFFTPLLYLNTADKYTAAIGLAYFNGQYVVKMGELMAGSFVLMLPLVVVFFIAQKTFVQGINLTGLTGR